MHLRWFTHSVALHLGLLGQTHIEGLQASGGLRNRQVTEEKKNGFPQNELQQRGQASSAGCWRVAMNEQVRMLHSLFFRTPPPSRLAFLPGDTDEKYTDLTYIVTLVL